MADSDALGLKLLRGALAAIFIGLMCAPLAAFADEIQEATKLLKAGQHQQALDKVNKVLASPSRAMRRRASSRA